MGIGARARMGELDGFRCSLRLGDDLLEILPRPLRATRIMSVSFVIVIGAKSVSGL